MSNNVLETINTITTFISQVNGKVGDIKGEDDVIDTLVCKGICEEKLVKTSTRINGCETCQDCIFGLTDNSVLDARMGEVIAQLKLLDMLEG